MPAKPNSYSRQWFQLFHIEIDDSRTDREIAFVCQHAPLPDFRSLADVCCGMGRHARVLSSRGYLVVGIDRDAEAISQASKLGGGPDYTLADIRDYRPKRSAFDVAIVMGQSFGYFDAVTNRDVLRQLAFGVRKGGRMILDLWNPEFFRAHQAERELQTRGGTVRERKRIDNDRLRVQLEYPDGATEQFEWELFTSAKMKQLGESTGLKLLLCGTDFDASIGLLGDKPRMQFVLERL